ncbi:hypothetical protein TSMEX_000443 [Taenia solium]|eukprot:TsM_001191600 transcript=TsM_001191600 gene=TsM_001191600
MPMIVEENEELENGIAERVEGGTDNTPNDGSGASTAAVPAADDAFAMIVHNQGTSNVAMVSEHISSFEGTEICVQPVKEESTSEGGSAIGQDTQRGGYSLRPKTEFVLPSFRGIRTSSLTLPSHSLLPKKASQDYPSFRLAAKARKTCAERVEGFRTLNKIARPCMTMWSARTDLLEAMRVQRRGFAVRIN